MDFSLAIATPFYEVKGYSPYISSLAESFRALNELGVKYDYYELSGDSYVDRAKNSLINKFMKSEFTNILMVDSDLAWNIKGFLRIIKAGMLGAEVVGGAYPNKNNWATYGCIPLTQDGYMVGVEAHGLRLLEASGIPGGFILYNRKAIDRTRPNLNTYKDYRTGEDILECFKCSVEAGGERVGEDIYFQRRYREAGGKVWLEPDIDFVHYGTKGYQGNYHNFLMERGKRLSRNRIEGFMENNELDLLNYLSSKCKSVAEIGVFKGRSTKVFADNAEKVYAIDHWEPWPEGTFDEYIVNVGYRPNVETLKGYSTEMSKQVDSVDMVFIDGDHTYEGCKADIEAWLPKCKKIISGHDYSDDYPGVRKAVAELIKNYHVVGSIWWAEIE